MFKKGFTLAEVLITIAVLGIVAGSTIYIIKNFIPEEHTFTSKKVSVTLSDGVKNLLDNDKLYPNKQFTSGSEFCQNYSGLFKNPQSSNCNAAPASDSDLALSAGDILNDSLYSKTNLITSDGETWIGLNQTFVSNDKPIGLIIDVNGKNKGKNKVGEDVVLLSLYPNGKIGEFETISTSTSQMTPETINCEKCEYTNDIITECTNSNKGKKKPVCASAPQCNIKPENTYSCCDYIYTHFREYKWNSWLAEPYRYRTTKDDLGKTCTQYCDDLNKKPQEEIRKCSSTQKQMLADRYYLPYGRYDFNSFLNPKGGELINACTNNYNELACCDYMKNNLSQYLARWNNGNKQWGGTRIIKDDLGVDCPLHCKEAGTCPPCEIKTEQIATSSQKVAVTWLRSDGSKVVSDGACGGFVTNQIAGSASVGDRVTNINISINVPNNAEIKNAKLYMKVYGIDWHSGSTDTPNCKCYNSKGCGANIGPGVSPAIPIVRCSARCHGNLVQNAQVKLNGAKLTDPVAINNGSLMHTCGGVYEANIPNNVLKKGLNTLTFNTPQIANYQYPYDSWFASDIKVTYTLKTEDCSMQE